MSYYFKKLVCLPLLFFFINSFGQITFPQNIYSVNENVIVYGTFLVTSVENGISGSSQQISNSTDHIDLGSTSQPGLYLVSFILSDNSRQTYLIEIGDASTEIDNSIIDFTTSPSITDEQKNIFVQIFNFFKNKSPSEMSIPFVNATKNFGVEHAISIVHNVAFCFAAVTADGSVEMLDVLCKDMSEDNLKDLTVELYKELFKELLDQGYITQQQYDDLKIDDFVSLTKMLQIDCSSFFDFIADRIENETLKMAIKYQGQLCSSTTAIIKEYKLP